MTISRNLSKLGAKVDASGIFTPDANTVTRAKLGADAKNWVFLGTGTNAANAVRTGTVVWTGLYQQLMVEYFIAGYQGNAVGRIQVGNTAPLDTATTCCGSVIEGIALDNTSINLSGWTTSSSNGAVSRFGYMFIDNNISALGKRMTGYGQHGAVSASVPPIQVTLAGFSTLTASIQQLVMVSFTTASSTVVGSTLTANSFVNVWGRNND
jgi:hypothetical protein